MPKKLFDILTLICAFILLIIGAISIPVFWFFKSLYKFCLSRIKSDI